MSNDPRSNPRRVRPVSGMSVWCVVAMLLAMPLVAAAQQDLGRQLAELVALREAVKDSNTRVRVAALHRVWSIALDSTTAEVKLSALELLTEPAGSSSDHIRMPAVYAIAEIASSSGDPQVRIRALGALNEPLQAGQVPIRDVAIDAVNSITRSGNDGGVAVAAVRALSPAIRSGTNGVRIPAINALVRAVEGSADAAAHGAALDVLVEPLDSSAVVGGMEARMMAVAAVEKIGVDAGDIATKAKAMGLLQAYGARGGWEDEARQRAQDGARRVEASMRQP